MRLVGRWRSCETRGRVETVELFFLFVLVFLWGIGRLYLIFSLFFVPFFSLPSAFALHDYRVLHWRYTLG